MPNWQGQPSSRPGRREPDGTPMQTHGLPGFDPSTASAFTIRSRCEFVWEYGASKRPSDLDADGIIDANEQQMAYNKSILKKEVLAAPARLCPSRSSTTGGFEGPGYTTTAFGTGMLEGQPIGVRRSSGNERSTPAQHGQHAEHGLCTGRRHAGRADEPRRGCHGSVGRQVNGFPLTNTVTINWAMRVQGPAGGAGYPVRSVLRRRGVRRYASIIGLIGLVGCRCHHGRRAVSRRPRQGSFGNGATVAFGAWNNFEIRLNFTTKQYSVFLNGAFLRTEGFVDQANKPGGINRITDATMPV